MGQIDKRLAELGITLPVPAKPVANYVGWVRTGNLVYTAGQVSLKDGKIEYQGKVGSDYSVEDAQKAARLCAINIIAQIKEAFVQQLLGMYHQRIKYPDNVVPLERREQA